VLLASYEQEASLTPTGVRIVRDDLCAILVARLFSEAGWRRYPEYAQVPIQRPLVIAGMPRTGTTTLQRLLAADPANQGLELWLTHAPQPRPARSTWPTDPIFQLTQQRIDMFIEQIPGYLGIHNRKADGAEECWMLTRQSMRSMFFEFVGQVPTYSAWLAKQDWTDEYERYRRNLQLIGLREPEKRWVLKSSTHMVSLDALLTALPDALVIQTHRRPASKMLGSGCSLVSKIAGGRSSTYHGTAIGPSVLELYTRILQKFATDRARHDPASFYDVEFDEFTADPLAVIADIYRYIGCDLTDEARTAMSAALAEEDSLRGHRYDLADFGVSVEEADSRLGALI
jgi:hypothetical protein